MNVGSCYHKITWITHDSRVPAGFALKIQVRRTVRGCTDLHGGLTPPELTPRFSSSVMVACPTRTPEKANRKHPMEHAR